MARQGGTGLQPGLLGPRSEPQGEVGDTIRPFVAKSCQPSEAPT